MQYHTFYDIKALKESIQKAVEDKAIKANAQLKLGKGK